MNNKIVKDFGITKKQQRDFYHHDKNESDNNGYIDDVLLSLHLNALTEKLHNTVSHHGIMSTVNVTFCFLHNTAIRNNFKKYIFEKYNCVPPDDEMKVEVENWFLSIYYHFDKFVTVLDTPYTGKLDIPPDEEFVVKFS